MTLTQAVLEAATVAVTMGHVLGLFEKDTLFSAVAECTKCNRLVAVDVLPDGETILGSGVTNRCAGRRVWVFRSTAHAEPA